MTLYLISSISVLFGLRDVDHVDCLAVPTVYFFWAEDSRVCFAKNSQIIA